MNDISLADVQAIIDDDPDNYYAQQYKFYPLVAPGMPLPGPNFCAHAAALGDETPMLADGKGADKHVTQAGLWLTSIYLRCLYTADFHLPVEFNGERHSVRVIPGHVWGGEVLGPEPLRDPELPADEQPPVVMIVGKMPGRDELLAGRNLVGPTGDLLSRTLRDAGMNDTEIASCYVCNVVRWQNLNPRGGTLSRKWIQDCAPLLQQEFRLVRPDYVLCLGAEASKEVCGRQNNVRNMIGRHVEVTIPLHELGEEPEYHTMKVMSVVHPASVLRQTELHPQYEATVKDFVAMVHGQVAEDRQADIVVQPMRTLRELRQYVDTVLAQPGLKKLAVDCEWEGEHPGEPDAYLRTVQVSHNGHHAAVLVLRDVEGKTAFAPNVGAAMAELRRLLDRDDVQLLGSFFASDIPWLLHEGCDIRHRFVVPPDYNDIVGGDYAGGFDVALGMHAYAETGDLKLEIMATRYCGASRWDIPIMQWRKKRCSELNIKEKDLTGYGTCPDELLVPYGGYDAAYTWQVGQVVCELLHADRYGNASWIPFHRSMMAVPAFCEMGINGVSIDRERVDNLTDLYIRTSADKLATLRDELRWPDFNPRSSQQCVELLFGEEYSTKRDAHGNRLSVRPEGAISLYLTPVKSTGARGTPWERVLRHGEVNKYTPSTDKETLGILGLHSELALKLRDVRLIDQVLKSVLRPPTIDEAGQHLRDQCGHRIYGGGIASYICADGRVRSAFLQTMETGRASSSRPPLQNLSKRREGDYKRILGDAYQWKIRSFIVSSAALHLPT